MFQVITNNNIPSLSPHPKKVMRRRDRLNGFFVQWRAEGEERFVGVYTRSRKFHLGDLAPYTKYEVSFFLIFNLKIYLKNICNTYHYITRRIYITMYTLYIYSSQQHIHKNIYNIYYKLKITFFLVVNLKKIKW